MAGLAGLIGLCFAALLAASSAAGAAGDRVALVIGNSAYQKLAPLENSAADAADMAAALTEIGYEVVHGENLTQDGFKDAAQRFLAKITQAETALFYYAGHGVQVDDVNYLLPVDADLETPTDVVFDAILLQDILRLMEQRARISVVLLDACRDNPLGQRGVRTATRGVTLHPGLAPENGAAGTYLAFAAQPGKASFDGDGRNSPFTAALLRHIRSPDVDVRLLMADVRQDVAEVTQYQQIPWESSSLIGRFSLRPPVPEGLAAKPRLVILPAEALPSAVPEEAAEPSGPAEAEPAPPETARALATEADVAAARPPADPGPKAAAAQSSPAEPERLAVAPPIAPLPDDAATATAEPSLPEGEDLAVVVQAELIRLGCLDGRADGVWGKRSESALRSYAERKDIELAALDPAPKVLEMLRRDAGRVCPLTCSAREVAQDGRCVAKTCGAGQALHADGSCREARRKIADQKAPTAVDQPRKPQTVKKPPVERAAPAPKVERAAPAKKTPEQWCAVCPDS